MIKLKDILKEGYAWERGADGKLPTLASSTARHAANENVTDSEEDKLDQISKELNKASKMHKGQSEKIANLVKENTPGKSDPEALKAALVAMNDSQDDMTSEDLLGAIEDGYYALSDNLPSLINDMQKAIKVHAKINPKDMDQIGALQNELKIYKGIQALIGESAIGTVL